jgi:hypothetical protein
LVAIDDAVTLEQLVCPGFLSGLGLHATDDGPAASGLALLRQFAFRVDQDAEILEVIRRDETSGDEFPETFLYFARFAVGGSHELVEETGPFLSQCFQNAFRRV